MSAGRCSHEMHVFILVHDFHAFLYCFYHSRQHVFKCKALCKYVLHVQQIRPFVSICLCFGSSAEAAVLKWSVLNAGDVKIQYFLNILQDKLLLLAFCRLEIAREPCKRNGTQNEESGRHTAWYRFGVQTVGINMYKSVST